MSESALRVVYMGTPDFAVGALEALIASKHQVVGVVTQPDRKSGRGKKLHPTPVKVTALNAEIDVFQPERLRKNDDAFERISAWKPDIAVVAAYGQILPQRFLDIPRLGCVNIHASLLPKYRGASPINAAIVNGDTETGVTTMQMERGLDTGPMFLKRTIAIGELETASELHDRLAALGAGMIVETIEGLDDGSITPQAQDDSLTSYASLLTKADGRIDWTKSAKDVANLVRGYNPWPGAHTTLRHGGEDLAIKIRLARPTDGQGEPGKILNTQKTLIVACGEGALEILEIQPPGKRAMKARDFLNGCQLSSTDTFEH